MTRRPGQEDLTSSARLKHLHTALIIAIIVALIKVLSSCTAVDAPLTPAAAEVLTASTHVAAVAAGVETRPYAPTPPSDDGQPVTTGAAIASTVASLATAYLLMRKNKSRGTS